MVTRRGGRWFGIATLLAGSALVMPACRAEQLAIGDGRSLFMTCAGTGGPTVILESGWAADHQVWATVQAELARITRTCSYDRAGTGRSPPGPLPRTRGAIASDLLGAVKAAGISDDLIIVGHSIGAVYARATERLGGGRVVGLVLVDPTVEAMAPEGLAPFIANAEACLSAVSSGQALPKDGAPARCAVRPTEELVQAWRHRVSELQNLFPPEDKPAIDQERVPVRVEVLSAGQDSETIGGKWRIAQHEALARSFVAGRHRVVAASGHMMMRDAPTEIVEATRAIVLGVRSRTIPR